MLTAPGARDQVQSGCRYRSHGVAAHTGIDICCHAYHPRRRVAFHDGTSHQPARHSRHLRRRTGPPPRRTGPAMTKHSAATDHPTRRLVVALPGPYDQAREHYETLIPEADLARFFQMPSWQANLELAGINAPHGFMRYYRLDITAVMAGSPSLWKATQYLIGNHTIAERMFRQDPSVMLHAPLRTLMYAAPTGDTGNVASSQPSLPVPPLRQPAHRRRRPRTRRPVRPADHPSRRRPPAQLAAASSPAPIARGASR